MAKKIAKKSKSTKMTKSIRKLSFFKRFLILVVIGVVLLISLPFSMQISEGIRLYTDKKTDYDGKAASEVVNYGDTTTRLLVHFIDVGQGDATFIELPDGKTILIDGGKDKEKSKLLDYLDEADERSDDFNKVKDGGKGFDYVILTHADEDHCGGIDDAINSFGVQTFYRPNEMASYKGYTDPGRSDLRGSFSSQSTLAYSRALTAGYKAGKVIISESGLMITAELDKSSSDYYELVFYSPLSDTYTDRNNYSPIMILYFRGKKIALSGDAEKAAEEEFVKAVKEGNGIFAGLNQSSFYVDVIKAGHHGSRTSTGDEYLSIMTKPETVANTLFVISCGINNSYGHPHEEVLSRAAKLNIPSSNILRTDYNSTIVIAIGSGILNDADGFNAVFVGAEQIAKIPSITISGVIIDWTEIAITIFVCAALLLIIEPLFASVLKTAKKSTKTSKKKSKANTKSKK